jgi:putative transposase
LWRVTDVIQADTKFEMLIFFPAMDQWGLNYLPRLERHFYRNFAAVLWTMNVLPSVPGWLTVPFHSDFRELLLHACVQEQLVCPAYCLMPDHLHLVWLGLSLESNQLNGMKFFRKQLNRLLDGESLSGKRSAVDLRPQPPMKWKLQPQAHDHVLREEERKRGAFASVCFYVMANPVRAGLAKKEVDWPYSGAVIPGYPQLHPMQENFWELFWKIYYARREAVPIEPGNH